MLLFSPMQVINGAQFFGVNRLSRVAWFVPATVMVPLIGDHKNFNLKKNFESNFISYVVFTWLIIYHNQVLLLETQFFDWSVMLSNKFINF